MTSGAGRPLGVLLVCTANVCRSPAAEVLLRRALGPAADVRVTSAGLDARPGTPVDPTVLRLLGEHGSGPGARQLTAALVAEADLVLTMTRDQRAALVSRHPAAVRRTSTLREFAALATLAADDGTVLPPAPGEALAALRGLVPRLRPRHTAGPGDDVADPHGLGEAEYRAAVEAIGSAVTAIVRPAGVLQDVP